MAAAISCEVTGGHSRVDPGGMGGCWGGFWWCRKHSFSKCIKFGFEVNGLDSLKVEDWCSLHSSGLGVLVGCENILTPSCG